MSIATNKPTVYLLRDRDGSYLTENSDLLHGRPLRLRSCLNRQHAHEAASRLATQLGSRVEVVALVETQSERRA